MNFSSGGDRAFEQLMQQRPGADPGVVKKSLATKCQESFVLETFHQVRVFASERR